MAFLKRELARLNVRVFWGTRVERLDHRSGEITSVRANDTNFKADEFVIAGGSWTPKLCKGLSMQAGKGYSLTLTKPRQLPKLCAIFTEARMAITPMGSSLRFGGTMEIAGLNEEINPRRIRGIIKAVPKYYPEFREEDFAEVKAWCGLRPCSPDGLPYLGRSRYSENVIIATGHAMMGLSLGPITGRLVAEMISGEKPSMDISLLNPDRYA